MDKENKALAVGVLRIVQAIGIAAVVVGTMWQGTESLKLSVPQFLMLYGAVAATVSELAIRGLDYMTRKFRE